MDLSCREFRSTATNGRITKATTKETWLGKKKVLEKVDLPNRLWCLGQKGVYIKLGLPPQDYCIHRQHSYRMHEVQGSVKQRAND